MRSARPMSSAAVPAAARSASSADRRLGRDAVGQQACPRPAASAPSTRSRAGAERRGAGRPCTRRRAPRGAASPTRRRGRPAAAARRRGRRRRRGVRSVPSADTSVGDTMPSGVTSTPPTAKLTSSRTSAASAAAAAGSGSSAASVGAASAAVSSSGSGRPARPASSSTPTRSTSLRPKPVGRLGHDERRRPELGQHGPAVLRLRGPALLVGQLEGAQRVGGALGVEHGAHALAQRLLLLGEGEVHDSAAPPLSPGAARAGARPPRCAGSRWSRRRWARPGRRGSRRATRRARPASSSSASGPSRSRAAVWMATSVSDQKILLQLASGPTAWPRATLIAVQYVCSL